MKTTFITAAAFAALAILSACHPEQEYHYTGIHYPKGLVGTVYADQLVDSISFTVLDSWTLQGTVPWATVSPVPDQNHGTVPAGYYMQPTVPVYFEANTTGAEREARFNLISYNSVLSAFFKQLPHHNVSRPSKKDENGDYYAEYTKAAKLDSIAFTAYSAWMVTLEPAEAAQWIDVQNGLRGDDGTYIVKYTVAAWSNADDTTQPQEADAGEDAAETEEETRTATLLINGDSRPSQGVTTRVVITQRRK